jgi:hypothetical protein
MNTEGCSMKWPLFSVSHDWNSVRI